MSLEDRKRELERAQKIIDDVMGMARDAGAEEVAARYGSASFVSLKQRDGEIETLQSSKSRGLSVSLFVDGRYSSNSTSFLEHDALSRFVAESLEMTRRLAPDPNRRLPEPELYGELPDVDLEMFDERGDGDMDARKGRIAALEDAARAGEHVISATAEMTTQDSMSLRVHSNGFRGHNESTTFFLGASVTVRDDDGRRPEDYCWVGARHFADLPPPPEIGAEATRRATQRRGASKAPSARMTLVVENRIASRLLGSLLAPLGGSALQQGRSCFEGMLGEKLGSDLLDVVDDPLIPRGLASRLYDGDGLPATKRSVLTKGVLDRYFINVYYGRKLEMAPTSGSASNLLLTPGERSMDELVGGVERGVLVTSFLGGNANPATGDFSFGVGGFLIEGGQLTQPVSEMNIADNHTELWKRLSAVGNDPYPFSAWRLPTLVFDDVQFSGS
ncbi:MAG: TldD/PmbA family protein [Myxococcales bacterium]|nr:TldD/PmbA family protein [Myxococcales bacterium]